MRLLLLLFATYSLLSVTCFVPSSPTISKQSRAYVHTLTLPPPTASDVRFTAAAATSTRTRSTQIHALASPPAEEEKEKKGRNDQDNHDSDWTPSRGGFLPNLGGTKQRQQRRQKQTNAIQQVVTMEDYKTVVVDEEDVMVVVRFYAPWCRACKAVQPLYERLADEYSPSIKFVEVPLTRHNAFLHEGLGVASFPFAHIYHPTVGLVEEMSMNKRTFHDFRHVLETYIDGSCDIPQDDL